MDWDWERLGAALRDRRKELLLTQEQLAELAGVHAATIKDYESGQSYKRFPKSWTDIEPAIMWAPGSARAVLEGREATLLASGRYTRERISDVNELVRDIVLDVTSAFAPDTPLSQVKEAIERAREIARDRGFVAGQAGQMRDEPEWNAADKKPATP